MGRHAPGTTGAARRPRALAVVASLVVLLLAVAGGGVWAALRGIDVPFAASVRSALKPSAPAPSTSACRQTVVRVAATPSVSPAVRDAVAGLENTALTDGTCLHVDVQGVTPDQFLAAAGAQGDTSRLPDLWVPDATLWVSRAPAALKARSEGSLATSPVVLASSRSALAALGWTPSAAPAWAQAVTGVRPVATDLTTDTCGLATALALHTTLGGDGAPFRRALAALSLAVDHATTAGAAAPMDQVAADDPATPLVPMTEQSVLAQQRSGLTALAMVYPRDGSPVLDFPLVSLTGDGRGTVLTTAVSQVRSALLDPAARTAFAERGFRVEGGAAPAGDGVRTEALTSLPLPGPKTVTKIVATLTALAPPTRMLAVIDVSTSMKAELAPGVTRIDLVAQASAQALQLFPSQYSVGTWVFASRLNGSKDYLPIAPVDRLDAVDGGVTHRQRLVEELKTLPARLNNNGTSIYDTVAAAVKRMQEDFDPGSENVIVLLTDGANTDRAGLSLDQLVTRLKATDGTRRVRIVAIGIGPTADMPSLKALAEATPAGAAYQALKPEDLGSILVDALANRG